MSELWIEVGELFRVFFETYCTLCGTIECWHGCCDHHPKTLEMWWKGPKVKSALERDFDYLWLGLHPPNAHLITLTHLKTGHCPQIFVPAVFQFSFVTAHFVKQTPLKAGQFSPDSVCFRKSTHKKQVLPANARLTIASR